MSTHPGIFAAYFGFRFMKCTYFLLAAFLVFSTAKGQSQNKKHTISGQIRDAGSGEDLPFCNVIIKNLSGVGTTSNLYGFYSISLVPGKYQIDYQFMGYQTIQKEIDLTEDIRIDIDLPPNQKLLNEVVVMAESDDQNITRNEGSVTTIDMQDIQEIPSIGGEPDVIRAIQMNPGIKMAGEGNSGFYVRGGGLDQNLVMLDEAPVYNPSHLLGFFSVFNGDAIKSATVYKGGMMPEYGGRTSSVMDVRMKEGNNKKFRVSGGIGTISSRLTVEGPIVKDKGSFLVSARRTYADLFLKLSSDESLQNTQLYFYDINLKANYRFSDKDRLYLSGYFGRDKFGFDGGFGLDWGNATGTLRWNHLFSDKLFSNTSLIYSDYNYEFGIGSDEDALGLESVIRDINIKQDFSYFMNDKNNLKFGFNVIHHNLEPGNLQAGSNTGITSSDAEVKYALEGAVYLQNQQKITQKLSLNYGLRYSFFNQFGSGTSYEFDDKGNMIGAETYGDWESMQYYGGFEPRLSATYLLDEKSSVKLGYNRNYQYIHLLTNATSSTPTDSWIMSSNNVKPQISDQISLGYFRNFKENMYEASAEIYYKDMQNAIDYRNGANVFLNDQVEGELVYGDGKAYGLELYLKKKKGKLHGWVSYTLSRTLRRFDEIDNGDWFSARQDRIHDISLVAMYDLSPKLTLSANFVYYTGDAVTFPSGRYVADGKVVPYYTERNGYRMPDYHRLDLGLTWKTKQTEKFESSWNFSLYTAYGRENAYSITFQPNEDDPTQTEAVKLSLFRWIPSVSYNFKV